MKKFFGFLDDSLEEAIAVVIFALISIFMGIQVIARYVFNASRSWPEEVCVFLLIWLGMISVSYCIKKQSSIRVEMIINLFPVRIRRYFRIIEDVFGTVFYGLMCFPAWTLVQNVIRSGQVSPALHIPMYFVQAAPLVAFILAVIRSIQHLVLTIRNKNVTEEQGGELECQ